MVLFSFVYRGTEWNIVHRSARIKNTLNPKWQEEEIDLSVLCGGNVDLPLHLSVLDHESSGKHVSMGMVETSVSGLVKAKSSKLTLKKSGKDVGQIAVHVASVSGVETLEEKIAELDISSSPDPEPEPEPEPEPFTPVAFVPPPPSPPTFLDYVKGGCEMQMCVAIDFTGSNGDPRKPGTLHYRFPDGGMNDYEKAISSIGGLLADYDTDKKFPVWGKSIYSRLMTTQIRGICFHHAKTKY